MALCGDAPLIACDGSVYNTLASAVPGSHVPLLYSLNTTLPCSALPPEDVIVAESFGSQFCCVETDVVSVTVIVSVIGGVVSGQAVGPAPLVFGESPL